MDIRKGDMVVILSGVEKGKQGRVLWIDRKKQRVVVEKIKLIKRHTKPGRGGLQQGGIIEKESPIHVSKVALLDPRSGEPTRVRHQVLHDGGRLRISAISGDTIDKPKE